MYRDTITSCTIKKTTLQRLKQLSRDHGTGEESIDSILNDLLDSFLEDTAE